MVVVYYRAKCFCVDIKDPVLYKSHKRLNLLYKQGPRSVPFLNVSLCRILDAREWVHTRTYQSYARKLKLVSVLTKIKIDMCICKRVLSFAYLLYKPDKGLFIIYGGGGRDFEGTPFFGKSQMGATYFWHVADGDTFLAHFFSKPPRKPTFCAFRAKIRL